MGTVLILVLLFALTPLVIRLIRPWLIRKLQERILRQVYRQATGQEPPRSSRRTERPRSAAEEPEARRQSRRSRRSYRDPREPIIPPEYPVDVEFTEIRDYSEQTEITGTDGRSRFSRRFRREDTAIRAEQQVSDAEWVEIKSKKQ